MARKERSGYDAALGSPPRPDVEPGKKRIEAPGRQLIADQLLAVAVRPDRIPVPAELRADRSRIDRAPPVSTIVSTTADTLGLPLVDEVSVERSITGY
jgi:hypothetical protein